MTMKKKDKYYIYIEKCRTIKKSFVKHENRNTLGPYKIIMKILQSELYL